MVGPLYGEPPESCLHLLFFYAVAQGLRPWRANTCTAHCLALGKVWVDLGSFFGLVREVSGQVLGIFVCIVLMLQEKGFQEVSG